MTATAARSAATYDDLVRAGDDGIAEIILGELITTPRPSGPHAIASSALAADLHSFYQRGRGGGPGGWWIVYEPELHLDGHVLVPDLAGWRKERLPAYPRGAGVAVPPDWVCEVLSDSTRAIDRVRKLPLYASLQVAFAWLVDPIARTLEVFAQHHGRWTLLSSHEGDAQVRAEPFAHVAIALSPLWDLGETATP
ncbi:MAG: Uma2 family endonuclease [Polyangiales bacterium]